MVDFTFDGPNRLMIEPAGAGDTTFNVGRDLYSAWKRWVQSGPGAQFVEAFAVEGGTPIGATGLFTGSTIVLVNGWKVRGAEHDHQLTLVGNLFSDDGVVAVPSLAANVTVFVASSLGAQGIATGTPDLSTLSTQVGELHRMRGLDPANPVTVTPAEEVSGDITLDIAGDGENTSTLTRTS